MGTRSSTRTPRTDPESLPEFVRRHLEQPRTLVKAARNQRNAPLREVGSWLYNLEARVLFGVPSRDVNGTPKVFARALYDRLALTQDGDLLDLELIAQAVRLGTTIQDVSTFGFKRHGGKSSTTFRSAWRMYVGAAPAPARAAEMGSLGRPRGGQGRAVVCRLTTEFSRGTPTTDGVGDRGGHWHRIMSTILEHIADDWFRQRRGIFYPKTDIQAPDEVLRGMRDRTFAALGMTPDRITAAAEHALGVRPAEIRPLERQGTFHRVFRLSGLGRPGGLILRASAANDLLHELSFYLDAWAGETMARAGLPAVAVRHIDLSRTVVPFDFQIVDECPGQPLDHFNHDEPRMQRLLGELGRHVAAVHSIPAAGYGLLDARPLAMGTGTPCGMQATWLEYIGLNLTEHVEHCTRAGDITRVEADAILRAFDQHAHSLAGDRRHPAPR